MFNSLNNSPKDVVKAMKETDKLVKKLLEKRRKNLTSYTNFKIERYTVHGISSRLHYKMKMENLKIIVGL